MQSTRDSGERKARGEVAQSFDLSATHLNKVAKTLAAQGNLETIRGRHGGPRLIRRPESIRLGEVALVTGPDFQIASCMLPEGGNCPIYEPCVLRGILPDAANAFVAELNKWTLSDLIGKRTPLLPAIDPARVGMSPKQHVDSVPE